MEAEIPWYAPEAGTAVSDEQLAVVAEFMRDHDYGIDNIVDMLEKPRKFGDVHKEAWAAYQLTKAAENGVPPKDESAKRL